MNRRTFLQSTAAAATGVLILKPATVFGYQANSAVRLGLLGCGNRGSSVATSFAHSTNTRVVALGDLFHDRLTRGQDRFNKLNDSLGQPAIDPKQLFLGRHAVEQLAASPEVDMLQLSTPPWFHVEHLQVAVASGKHVYVEKPVGIDVVQARHALEIAKKVAPAQSVAVGFQCRNAPGIVAAADHIRSGALGKMVSVSAYYNAPASVEVVVPGASADEHRLRNWLWDRALSGDILVEQNIHIIDLCNWILGARPIAATATGGRNALTHMGDCWDNYQVDFEYPGGVHLSFASTQFGDYGFEAGLKFFGATGAATVGYAGPIQISGVNAWSWQDSLKTSPDAAKFAADGAFLDNLAYADRDKERAVIDAITSARPLNQIASGVGTALSCMLGRMAGYQKRTITWEELLTHGETYPLGLDMAQFA